MTETIVFEVELVSAVGAKHFALRRANRLGVTPGPMASSKLARISPLLLIEARPTPPSVEVGPHGWS